jgi:hypothetical protein
MEVPTGRHGNCVAWIIHHNLSLATIFVGPAAPKVIPHQKVIMVTAAAVSVFSLKVIHWRWNRKPYSYQHAINQYTFVITPRGYVVRKFCS